MDDPEDLDDKGALRRLPRRWWVPVLRVTIALVVILGALWGVLVWLTWSPGSSWEGPPPALTAEQAVSSQRLMTHVKVLAGDIGPRHIGRPATMRRSVEYISDQLHADGYEVKHLPSPSKKGETYNIEATLPGTSAPEEVVIVGAHYDTVSTTPGADDNATGVAAVLELAHQLRSTRPGRTVRFVLFTHEEPPFFRTAQMGSLVYAREAKERKDEQLVAMFSLEMIGYASDETGSQTLPPPLHLVYPTTGNFVAFISTPESSELTQQAVGAFRRGGAQVASEALSAPSWVTGVDFSDHWSFARLGIPAVMVTDTSFMRNANYHRSTDTPDSLNPTFFTHVTLGMLPVLAEVANP